MGNDDCNPARVAPRAEDTTNIDEQLIAEIRDFFKLVELKLEKYLPGKVAVRHAMLASDALQKHKLSRDEYEMFIEAFVRVFTVWPFCTTQDMAFGDACANVCDKKALPLAVEVLD